MSSTLLALLSCAVAIPAGGPVADELSGKGAGALLGDVPCVDSSSPPPAWIQPGLRLTYTTVAASLPGAEHEYTPDESGRWVDAQGRRYSRREVQGRASHGYLQANVVALGREHAALQLVFFLFEGMNTAEPLQKLETGFVAPAGTGGDLWLHPDVLRGLLAGRAPGLLVRRASPTIAQATYEGVQIIAVSGPVRGTWTYDLASGVLLESSNVVELAGTTRDDGEALAPGSSELRFSTFKGSRVLELPWSRAATHPEVLSLASLAYRGSFRVEQAGLVPTPLPFDFALEVAGRGPDWLLFRLGGPGAVPGLEDLSLRVAGNAQLGGLWIPPTGLASLRAGQVLDSDPFTRVTTSVARVEGGAVVLAQVGPRQSGELTYRASDGLLTHAIQRERLGIPGMNNVVELELATSR